MIKELVSFVVRQLSNAAKELYGAREDEPSFCAFPGRTNLLEPAIHVVYGEITMPVTEKNSSLKLKDLYLIALLGAEGYLVECYHGLWFADFVSKAEWVEFGRACVDKMQANRGGFVWSNLRLAFQEVAGVSAGENGVLEVVLAAFEAAGASAYKCKGLTHKIGLEPYFPVSGLEYLKTNGWGGRTLIFKTIEDGVDVFNASDMAVSVLQIRPHSILWSVDDIAKLSDYIKKNQVSTLTEMVELAPDGHTRRPYIEVGPAYCPNDGQKVGYGVHTVMHDGVCEDGSITDFTYLLHTYVSGYTQPHILTPDPALVKFEDVAKIAYWLRMPHLLRLEEV